MHPIPAVVDGATRRSGFRPDVEGLRAVAIAAVLLFHAGMPGLPGGFTGVDVFFVISGFLITRLLWRELDDTGSVRLARFYGARARRLLPAAGTVAVTTSIGAVALLPPLQARDVLGDGIASALYVGNYRFAWQGTSYLAADTPPSPFQHYWSLGVEEQFYLLWPALLIGTAVLARRATRPSVTPYLLVLTSIAAASFVVSATWTRVLPPWAFFSLPARAWELAAGGVVALSADRWSRLPPWLAGVLGYAGMAAIVLACVRLDARTPYPGVAAVLPVLGTALVIVAGPERGAGRVLSAAPMRALGRLSYSWYLWHWPVLLFTPPLLGHPPSPAQRLAAVAVSGVLAVLTLVLIENPGRFAKPLRRSPARSIVLGGLVTALAASTALVLSVLAPTPAGHGLAAPVPTIRTPAAPSSSTPDARDTVLQQMIAQVQASVAASAAARQVPANLTPPLTQAKNDKAAVFVNGCVRSWRDLGQPPCRSGDPGSSTTVALVGDSHAAMWSPAFEALAQQRHWRLETLGKVTCPMLDLPLTSPYLGREYVECEQWRGQVLDRLRTEHPSLVVLGMSRRYGADFGFTVYSRSWLDSLARTVAQLRSTGAAVLVLGPVPDPQSTVPACLSAHLDDATACTPPEPVAMSSTGVAAEATATTARGGDYADLTKAFCTAERCPVIIGNVLVYRDDNHLTTSYARTLTPLIGALADQALTRG
ncbi:acyltransferase family protein [Amycolatopsis australiensis]|uniref:Peptidoglycan/LPS O-acetylase OafA/YrhL, contains acyltransferase and SGNH-hydrolase domains n=1 Tax=Amycolatopsis australiensis TaxID=546364 RepID=A0A1K1SPL1_9PSEU|nr:acyltransferase family protein [Amycolatopsis australiensis]SFW86222.1 Peptidoglycan/LPS O-acetylase OafA/YrhL, contains acyltransferase and SGNH-hydrolase domains [Amycolatopsis australiensis]